MSYTWYTPQTYLAIWKLEVDQDNTSLVKLFVVATVVGWVDQKGL